ncbi:hypothetical protein ACFWWC_47260, partial [Streptomyces sp. NPDC058642]|uniref:hypothetical protein n=1 Tax=Streptomyces sp. NPDC058642 TaxID=3346572 RepID=UPI003652BE0E
PVAVHLCGHHPDAGANPRIRSNPYTISLDATRVDQAFEEEFERRKGQLMCALAKLATLSTAVCRGALPVL